ELRLNISETLSDNAGKWELSMGMSDDFPIAIAVGSTMVRIGTAIFGSRQS
ncbi:MAG: YggS family pyridoxal phosphate-dependent enzyme, partial [Calditrichaeota bacterium]|nr:YggS family pyridoxal phosphate-dependent enzyme [Calditrichota bacterium]